MVYILVFIISLFIGYYVGDNRRIGGLWSMFFCILFSPIVGYIISVCSERLKNHHQFKVIPEMKARRVKRCMIAILLLLIGIYFIVLPFVFPMPEVTLTQIMFLGIGFIGSAIYVFNNKPVIQVQIGTNTVFVSPRNNISGGPVNQVSSSRLRPIAPEAKTLKPEIEEQTEAKYIGYNPINIFAQTEPLNFPNVIMPKPGNVIKFPRKGRVGRKGFKEGDFKTYIDNYFGDSFQVFDDRFILVKNASNPYEPDFTLLDEKAGLNLFLDVEIDEPYEGLNDIEKRRVTHFQYCDKNRNNAFKNRGWVVVRFAEIQVHQQPEACCRFLSDVIKSICPNFNIHADLSQVKQIQPVRQWTREEAAIWSKERYREKYLGITSFGTTSVDQNKEPALETELGEQIEEQVEDDVQVLPPISPARKIAVDPRLSQITSAFQLQKFLSFSYGGRLTIVKPVSRTTTHITAYCYLKNVERKFVINEMSSVSIKDNYFTVRVAGPTIGLRHISNAVNTAINYQKHIRMKYTRIAWSNILVDKDTGELILNKVDAEESIRTINDVQPSISALSSEYISTYRLDNNYITAYCNKREEQRTFRFDRIGEIEILNI